MTGVIIMRLFSTLLMLACGGMSSLSWAMVTWKNPTPSALAPFNHNAKTVADLAGNQILLYSHPHQNIEFQTSKELKRYNNVQFTTGALVVHATSQQIQQTLHDYQKYVGLFPTLKTAKILEQQGNDKQVKYKISIPTPIKVLNFNDDAIIQHEATSNAMSSLVIDSPMPYGVSKIEWFALDAQRSLVTITQWTDTNTVNGFLISSILKAMPEAVVAMPYAVNTFVMESLRLRFNPKINAPLLAAGKVPERPLNQQQYQQIIQLSQKTKQPVSFVHLPMQVPYKHGNEDLRFTTSYQFFNAPPQQTNKLLEPTIYQKLFPKYVRKVEVLPNQDKSNDAVFFIRAGLGVITIPFTLRLRFFPPQQQSIDMVAVGGDIKFMKSKMEILPYQQHSVWKMSTASKIDPSAPFLVRSMRSLPYHDVIPTAAIARVITDKAYTELSF